MFDVKMAAEKAPYFNSLSIVSQANKYLKKNILWDFQIVTLCLEINKESTINKST